MADDIATAPQELLLTCLSLKDCQIISEPASNTQGAPVCISIHLTYNFTGSCQPRSLSGQGATDDTSTVTHNISHARFQPPRYANCIRISRQVIQGADADSVLPSHPLSKLYETTRAAPTGPFRPIIARRTSSFENLRQEICY
jgi:hypothetical protein